MTDPSIARFRRVVNSALAHIEAHRQQINDMNVFPVADGDTGDNMVHTLRAVVDELDKLNGQELDEVGRQKIVQAVARAALLGARGNSGVILSQIVRGAAEELVSREGELVDPVLVAAAFARAADAAYSSVREPVEGTMLTVMREMAHRVTTDLARLESPRLDRGVDDAHQNAVLADLLEGAVEAGVESVDRGPQLLPVLREAGVKDAGGVGVVALLNGLVAGLRGEEELPAISTDGVSIHPGAPHHASSRYRYCTNFVVSGERLMHDQLVSGLERLGDSVLVVGDECTVRVHIHADDPEGAVDLCRGSGEVSRLEVADMRAQVAEREKRLMRQAQQTAAIDQRCGVVAVAHGEGICELLAGLGAVVIDGGPTLNPSTVELLAAIHSVDAEEVVLMPNSPNVIMAADRAAEISEKRVEVVESRSPQAGLAALVELDPRRSATENAARLRSALARLRTGAIAPAARDDAQGRFKRGDAVGFIEEELIAWGSPSEALGAVASQLADDAELITCIVGSGAPLNEDEVAAAAPDAVEVDVQQGGQPHYWWLLTAE